MNDEKRDDEVRRGEERGEEETISIGKEERRGKYHVLNDIHLDSV